MAKTQLNLGIETSETGLKLALFDSKAKKVLRTDVVAMSQNPLHSVTEFEDALWAWLLQQGSPTLASISVSLPSIHGAIRDIRIPTDTNQPEEYIHWELASSLSTPIDNYYYGADFYPDAKKPQGALVAAFRRAYIDALRSFSNKKLTPTLVEPDIFALLNLLEYSENTDEGMHCVVKADQNGIMAFWGNGHSLGAVRWTSTMGLGVDPDSVMYPKLVENTYRMLMEGFGSPLEGKPQVRLCGELAAQPLFIDLLYQKAQEFELMLWDSFLKISLVAEGNTPNSVLNCTGAIGVAVHGGNRK